MISCYCCIKNQPVTTQKRCPECGHNFQGKGWDGIDAHWKSRHESIMPYKTFWNGLCDEHKGGKSSNWQRAELLLALDLYHRLPFGRLHQRNVEVIKLAGAIGRTPSAVAMKACNFASLDPAIHQQGLGNASVADKKIWEEFRENSYKTVADLEEVKSALALSDDECSPSAEQETEGIRETKVRKVQGFFRKSVLNSYDNKCALSGIGIPALLVASHIIPWAESEKRRADPTNGIALNALYDKAFDRGLISFGENLEVLLSKEIKNLLTNKDAASQLFSIEGRSLIMPSRFQPCSEALAWHRDTIFRW